MDEKQLCNHLCDRILVVLGYHSDELEWGKIVEKQFKERGLEKDRNISFYTIEDSPVPTGLESSYSERKINEEIEKLGDVGLLVDMHCHPFLGISEEYATYDHEPHFYVKNDELIEHFKAVFPNTIACNEEPKKENTAYAIFDPDFFGPSSMTTAEVYEKGASKTVENLDKLCMVFERKGIEEIKSKYPEVIPTKKLGTISKTKGKNCTGYIKDNTFVLGSNVDETAFLMLLDDYLKNREDKK